MDDQETIKSLKDLYIIEANIAKSWQEVAAVVIEEYEKLAEKTGNLVPVHIQALKIALGVDHSDAQ